MTHSPGSQTVTIMTLNLNGIRQACKKGLLEWIQERNFDVLCFQETRCDPTVFSSLVRALPQYHHYLFPAQKPGYSGVAILTRQKPLQITTGLHFESADREGRYIEAQFNTIRIASIYMPSGTSGEHRQQVKFDFLLRFKNYLSQIRSTGDIYILCGDFNIAHKVIDLKNWRANRKNAGFLPEEREWMSWLIDDMGFIDAFRHINPHSEQYTWWSHRGNAWANNVGWRIDYQVTTPALLPYLRGAEIFKAKRFSDHAPLIMHYQLPEVL